MVFISRAGINPVNTLSKLFKVAKQWATGFLVLQIYSYDKCIRNFFQKNSLTFLDDTKFQKDRIFDSTSEIFYGTWLNKVYMIMNSY